MRKEVCKTKPVYARLGGREAGARRWGVGGRIRQLQGHGRAGLWRTELEDEAKESMMVMAPIEEVPTTHQEGTDITSPTQNRPWAGDCR